MIWIYAICERAGVTPLPGTGLGGAALDVVGDGELLAVVSRHAELPDVRALDAVWAHEHVVECLMAEGPVLPMRFGSRLRSVAAVRAMLAARRYELHDALDGVRGRVELAVRVLPAAGRDRQDAPGAELAAAGEAEPDDDAVRAYVRHRMALLEQVDAAGAALHAPLSAAAVAERRHPVCTSGEVLRASYLVEHTGVAAFRSLVQRLQVEHQEVAILCTGPWPPYSFVDEPVAYSLVGGEAARE